MQAITTKYLCPTNTRGARIIAKAAAGTLTVGYDHALDMEGNHRAAAQAFVEKKGWGRRGQLATGQAHNGDYVHVLTTAASALREITKWACTGSDRYESMNPYSRPAIKTALQALADIDGHGDYLDVDLNKA